MNELILSRIDTPLGAMTMAGDETVLTGLWFDGQAHFGAGLTGAERARETELSRAVRAWLAAYFDGAAPEPAFALAPRGTPFQKAVWSALAEIPRGGLATYGQIAAMLSDRTGRRVPARAVGGAVARNPISIVIPCHRVVGANGSLTGYAGGLERKRRLLRLEGALPPDA